MPGPLPILEALFPGATARLARGAASAEAATRRALDDVAVRIGATPYLEDNVIVEVVGQPGVTKQDLYYLAMAAANGMVRRFGNLIGASNPYGKISIEYDAADHWVRASISYRWAMLAVVAGGFGPAPSIVEFADKMAVYRGPQCDVVGGDFDFKAPEAGADAVFRLPTGLPNLPFKGQTILTACPTTKTPLPQAVKEKPAPTYPGRGVGAEIPSPNPKPPGDNRSRGAVVAPKSGPTSAGPPGPFSSLPGPNPDADGAKCCDKLRALVPLVYAALTSPASDARTTYAPPTAGAEGR